MPSRCRRRPRWRRSPGSRHAGSGCAAVDDGGRVGDGAATATDRHGQILVLDLGVVVAAAQGHQHVVGQVRLEVQLEALADGLVGVEQGGGVRDGRTGRP
ncbi:hypothetical protein G6F61_014537 [Rhizopus arrhizus]|nr:hypothetical protein G6F61_014537 [Rhizopus arrhizus]